MMSATPNDPGAPWPDEARLRPAGIVSDRVIQDMQRTANEVISRTVEDCIIDAVVYGTDCAEVNTQTAIAIGQTELDRIRTEELARFAYLPSVRRIDMDELQQEYPTPPVPTFDVLTEAAREIWGRDMFDAARQEMFSARFAERRHQEDIAQLLTGTRPPPVRHRAVTLSLPYGAVCTPLYIPASPSHDSIPGHLRIGEETYALSISTRSYDYENRTAVSCECGGYRRQMTMDMRPRELAADPRMVERVLTALVSEVVRHLSNEAPPSDILINSITEDYVEYLENSEKFSKLIKDGSIKHSDFHNWVYEEFPVAVLKQKIDQLFDEAVNTGETPVSIDAPYPLVPHISIPMSCGLRVHGITGDLNLPNILDNLKVNTREQNLSFSSLRHNVDGSVSVRVDPGF